MVSNCIFDIVNLLTGGCFKANAEGENFKGSHANCGSAAAAVSGGVAYNNDGFSDCKYFYIPGSSASGDLHINAVKCICSGGKYLLVQKKGEDFNVYY